MMIPNTPVRVVDPRLAVTRRARDLGLPGWITTSTGDRANLERLQGIAGGEVLVLLEGEDVIRERIRTSQGINRGEQCEQGIRRWFGRYSAAASDRRVR